MPDNLRRLRLPFLQEGLHDTFESADQQRFLIYQSGLDHGFLNFKNPPDIGTIHSVRAKVVRIGFQFFSDDVFARDGLFEQFFNIVSGFPRVIRFFSTSEFHTPPRNAGRRCGADVRFTHAWHEGKGRISHAHQPRRTLS